MPILPDDFQFSQSSLQDFADCPRRFKLRYLDGQGCPAVEVEPIRAHERRKDRGILFHRMVEQEQVGIPAERIEQVCTGDEELRTWWENYRRCAPAYDEARRFPEETLVGEVSGYGVRAKYDLIAAHNDGTVEIYDWKTSTRRSNRQRLTNRLQTRIYPYLLIQAGEALLGRQPEPNQVRMTYWFSNHPDDPETFSYNRHQYQLDKEYLGELVQKIAEYEASDYSLTSDEKHCRYCTYRSLCGRGEQAGHIEDGYPADLEDPEPMDMSFEDVADIAF